MTLQEQHGDTYSPRKRCKRKQWLIVIQELKLKVKKRSILKTVSLWLSSFLDHNCKTIHLIPYWTFKNKKLSSSNRYSLFFLTIFQFSTGFVYQRDFFKMWN